MLFDVFISHASEDKEQFVRELASELQKQHVEVWYDEFSLKAGDSLRSSIDTGLSKSRFGIVVLSPSFFNKHWTNWELDGLVARQNSGENKLIIPIWHLIDRDAILQYSPPLADKVAILSNRGIKTVAASILDIINPKGSTLIIARDYLISHDFQPPVITDDWWLDIVEYSGREWGYHDYLAFSIPWINAEPQHRGVYIAKHALQKEWQEIGEELWMSQMTPPEEVQAFLQSNPGLADACLDEPEKVALYFPQLTFKGFEGFMQASFEQLEKNNPTKGYSFHEEVAFRLPDFGGYDPAHLACYYFSGAGGGMGPSTRRYDMIDCVVWLLSDSSTWLPPEVRDVLLQGMLDWNAYDWSISGSDAGFAKNEYTGKLFHYIVSNEDRNGAALPVEAMLDIQTRIAYSKEILNLKEPTEQLVTQFVRLGFVDKLRERYSKVQ